MDFAWNAEQETFRATVRAFLSANLPRDWESLAHGPASRSPEQLFKNVLREAGGGRPAGTPLAQTLGRPRCRRLDRIHPGGGNVGGGRAPRRPVHERQLDRPDADALRFRGAAGPLHSADGARRDHLVPGILGAGGGLRPGFAPDTRGEARVELPHQRSENLDLLCAARRHLLPARENESGTRRHLRVPGADGHSRHHRARDPESHR